MNFCMGRHDSRTITRHARVPRSPRGPSELANPVLSLVGMALTAYLSRAASSGTGLQGRHRGGCDAVLSSRWATLLGAPTAVGLARLRHHGGTRLGRRAGWRLLNACSSRSSACHSVYLTTVSRCAARRDVSLPPDVALDHDGVVRGGDEPAAGRDAGLLAGAACSLRAAPAAAVVIALLHLNYVGVLGRHLRSRIRSHGRSPCIYRSAGQRYAAPIGVPHCRAEGAVR